MTFRILQERISFLQTAKKEAAAGFFLTGTLKSSGISPESISGYRNELVSDYSTAAAVAGGQADVALGESYAVRSFPELTFLPLTRGDTLSDHAFRKSGYSRFSGSDRNDLLQRIFAAHWHSRPDMIPHMQEKLSPCNYLMVCVHIFIYSG